LFANDASTAQKKNPENWLHRFHHKANTALRPHFIVLWCLIQEKYRRHPTSEVFARVYGGNQEEKVVVRQIPASNLTFFLYRWGDTEHDMMGVLMLLAAEKASAHLIGVNINVDGRHTLYTFNLMDPTGIFERQLEQQADHQRKEQN
jgi:hypothetical protein